MLNELKITNFKSIRGATINFAPLTVILGKNGSGKSNTIEALRFFSWIAESNKLYKYNEFKNSPNSQFRGTVKDIPFSGKEVVEFEAVVRIKEKDRVNFRTAVKLSSDEFIIYKESLSFPDENRIIYTTVGEAENGNDSLHVSLPQFNKVEDIFHMKMSCFLSPFKNMSHFFHFPQKPFPPDSNELKIPYEISSRAFKNIFYFNPIPQTMRGYCPINNDSLNEDGSNISNVLFRFCVQESSPLDAIDPDDVRQEEKHFAPLPAGLQQEVMAEYFRNSLKRIASDEVVKKGRRMERIKDESNKSKILDIMSEFQEPKISDILFEKTPRGEVILKLLESGQDFENEFYIENMSDGFLRTLAIILAAHTVPEGVLIIEEVDNGIHPNNVGKLLHFLHEIAKKRSISIVITTHNPSAIDSIPEGAVGDIVYCYRDEKNGESRLTRMRDVENYPDLLGQGALGELLTKGAVEKFFHSLELPDEIKERKTGWVKKYFEVDSENV